MFYTAWKLVTFMNYGCWKCGELGAGVEVFNIRIIGEHTMTCREWIRSGTGQEVAGGDKPGVRAGMPPATVEKSMYSS
jgi:hypothetical protein